jgi:hypothetical protein
MYMAETLERGSGVLSHDLILGSVEQRLAVLDRYEELQAEYTALIAKNPLFKAAVRTWVENENNGVKEYEALRDLEDELDAETADMTDEEKKTNPDSELHEMVRLRREMAELRIAMNSLASAA